MACSTGSSITGISSVPRRRRSKNGATARYDASRRRRGQNARIFDGPILVCTTKINGKNAAAKCPVRSGIQGRPSCGQRAQDGSKSSDGGETSRQGPRVELGEVKGARREGTASGGHESTANHGGAEESEQDIARERRIGICLTVGCKRPDRNQNPSLGFPGKRISDWMAPAYSFSMSTADSIPPCPFHRTVFSLGVVSHDVTTVYERRVREWWNLCWMCWANPDCSSP